MWYKSGIGFVHPYSIDGGEEQYPGDDSGEQGAVRKPPQRSAGGVCRE
jgi:hypothetical protein